MHNVNLSPTRHQVVTLPLRRRQQARAREKSISVDTMWGPIMVAFFATTAGVAYSLLDRAVHFDASEMLANNGVAIPLRNSLTNAREAVKRRTMSAKNSMKALKSSNSCNTNRHLNKPSTRGHR